MGLEYHEDVCGHCGRNVTQVEERRYIAQYQVLSVRASLRSDEWETVSEDNDANDSESDAWCYRCFIEEFGCEGLSRHDIRGWMDQPAWAACPRGKEQAWEQRSREGQAWLDEREFQHYDDTDMFAEDVADSDDDLPSS